MVLYLCSYTYVFERIIFNTDYQLNCIINFITFVNIVYSLSTPFSQENKTRTVIKNHRLAHEILALIACARSEGDA